MPDWTEKYRPTKLADVRGNNKSVKQLREWAEDWESGEEREPALVHGEPGVGKTSSVHALANDMGWTVVEMNASDARTADAVEEVAGEATRSAGLGSGRTLVVMDEADNLHGNADRGGSGAVTEMVKNASQPVVLIANDIYEMSRTLRNACREIEFGNVTSRSIVPVLRDICREEGIEFEKEALKAIADANSGDLRGAIHDLQAVAEGRSRLTVEDVGATGARDTTEDIFEFLDTVFKGDDFAGALSDARDVDESPDDLIHWIDENMPKVYKKEELRDGYYRLSRADVFLGRTRATQNYSLWRYANDNMVGVQTARRGRKEGWTRWSPPSTFRRLGQTRSKRDTRDSLARKVGEDSGASMASARDDIFPYMCLLFESDEETARRVVSELDLDADELSYLTGWSDSRAEEVAESDELEPEEVEEEEDEDESQSTLSNF
ncbi:MAG: replication factor C large subunit [Halobacteriales archaeon]|nr:replication factor C large subunit [Halobacteriales archaeon]